MTQDKCNNLCLSCTGLSLLETVLPSQGYQLVWLWGTKKASKPIHKIVLHLLIETHSITARALILKFMGSCQNANRPEKESHKEKYKINNFVDETLKTLVKHYGEDTQMSDVWETQLLINKQ